MKLETAEQMTARFERERLIRTLKSAAEVLSFASRTTSASSPTTSNLCSSESVHILSILAQAEKDGQS